MANDDNRAGSPDEHEAGDQEPADPETAATARRRSRLIGIARWSLTAVVLVVIVPRAHFGDLEVKWTAGTIAWIAGAVATTFVAVVLSAVRWQRVLAGLDLRARIRTLLSHHLACLFVSSFLPSTVGGDVLRVTRLSAANGERPATFASVVLERLTGWIVLPVITILGLAVNPGLFRDDSASRIALLIAVVTLALLSVVLWAAAHPRLGGRWADREGWTRFLGAVHLGVDRFRRKPGLALEVLASGFAYQFAIVLAAFMASQALGLEPEVGLTAIIAFMPAVAIVQVLPFPTVGGLGVREGAFVLFLEPLGVQQHEAIALGLLVYAITLAVSLLGAPSFAVGGKRVPARPRQPDLAA